jgi:hypothetical protein
MIDLPDGLFNYHSLKEALAASYKIGVELRFFRLIFVETTDEYFASLGIKILGRNHIPAFETIRSCQV